jgi:hypothetical protein
MFKKALVFILANFLFVVVAIAIYAIGYEYDKANKLHPESKWMSYDMSMQVYGERWARFAKVMLGIGILADGAMLMIWYRDKQKRNGNSILGGQTE